MAPGHQYTYRVFPVFIESGPNAYGVPALIDANSRGADLPTAARSVSADADGQNACVVTWRAPADDGGHPVRGYLIQIADDDDGEPGAWETIDIDGGTPPFTVMGGAMTEFKYTGTVAQLGSGNAATLNAGSVRWFRVIPITNENDGVETTGGAVLDEDGDPNTPRNGRGTTVPLTDDMDRADPAKCTTEGLGDAPADKVTADPQMPVDLTVEAASDTNSLADSDRGVFLTWNQQPVGDASKTTSYQINRIRMNTGVEALNDEADDWQFVKRVRDITSYTDSTDLRRDEETRMYQVCSEASGVADPVCVEMPVTYALHGAHEPDAPTEVMAEYSADGTMVTVSWTAPGSNGGSDITGYKVMYKMTGSDADYMSMDAAADATSATISDLTAGTDYDIVVVAVNAVGESAMAMAMDPTVANMAPTAAGMIAPVTVMETMESAMDVSMYFSDAEGDTLTYMAASSDDMVATASVYGSMVTITGVAEGMATITVTATDEDGSGMSAMQKIMVTVSDTPPATTAPMGAAHSVIRNSITVQWDPDSAQNTTLIKVALFNEDVTSLAKIDEPVEAFNLDAAAGDPGTHTFNNVPAGTYKVVVAAVDSEGKHVVSVVPDAVTIN